ncbi:hypothetical protein Hdeb2414_s0028g00699951 [Helianthus debilis subsp. tardiflorus]
MHEHILMITKSWGSQGGGLERKRVKQSKNSGKSVIRMQGKYTLH